MITPNFDEFLDSYYEEIRNTIKEYGNKQHDYQDIIEKVKLKIKYNQIKQKSHNINEIKKQEKDIINPIKTKTMNIGQSDIKEATKYSLFYKYKVQIINHKYTDKKNYAFKIDNSFFNKLFKKTENRFSYNHEITKFHSVVFRYNPKVKTKLIDDTMVNFEPFEIVVSTEGCHDFIYFHSTNYKKNTEILKGFYILNIQKVFKKLKNVLNDTNISDKGKTNMLLSLQKHLGSVQTPGFYNVSNNFEKILGFTELEALMILDDFDDEELLDTLKAYVL